MQNIKYHAITITTVIIFSYVAAITINGIIKNCLTVVYPAEKKTPRGLKNIQKGNTNIDINHIVESGFFVIAPHTSISDSPGISSSVEELKLIGTITGAPAITRALILKRGETQAGVFKPWNDVYGFKLTRVDASKVFLKKENQVYTLNLYEKKEFTNSAAKQNSLESAEGIIKKNISRAEMQQKIMNNLDTAIQGITAAPSKNQDGENDGLKLIRVRSINILYEYGLRSGDIIRRINGKKTDSTEKLLTMWQGMKNESKIVVDVERDGKNLKFELNILD